MAHIQTLGQSYFAAIKKMLPISELGLNLPRRNEVSVGLGQVKMVGRESWLGG